ncbi:unnamed protein product, partial [Brassica oleracea]
SVRISARWPFPWTVRVIFAHEDSTSVHISARWPFPWTVRAVRTALPPNGLSQRHVPLGAEAPTEGRQSGGGRMRRF